MLRKTEMAVVIFLALASVSLASKPKPMRCDSWACKGTTCSPARYQAVRHAFLPPWILASPTYGAALTESGVGMLAVLLGIAVRRARRAASAEEDPAVKAPVNL